jgi:hypothetical protein
VWRSKNWPPNAQNCKVSCKVEQVFSSAGAKSVIKSVAGGLGFEPRLTESESAVLPLNYPPPKLLMDNSFFGRIYKSGPKALQVSRSQGAFIRPMAGRRLSLFRNALQALSNRRSMKKPRDPSLGAEMHSVQWIMPQASARNTQSSDWP